MRVQQHRYPVLRKLAGGGSVGLTADIEVPESAIDRGAMAALAVITTDQEDRSRDIVRTAGIGLDNHRLNPDRSPTASPSLSRRASASA
jgi:hypothetical protein